MHDISTPLTYSKMSKPTFLTLTLFTTIFAGMICLDVMYKHQLFEPSHNIIISMQSKVAEDSSTTAFFERVNLMFEGQNYIIAIFIVSSFLSRERFWYYLISLTTSHFLMQILKLLFHDPRPS